MKPDTNRQALIDASIARYRKVLEQMLPDDNATLDQIERAIEDIGKKFTDAIMLINQRKQLEAPHL